jgi:hypothetical protein
MDGRGGGAWRLLLLTSNNSTGGLGGSQSQLQEQRASRDKQEIPPTVVESENGDFIIIRRT